MAWTAESTAGSTGAIGNTWTDIGASVQLNPGELAHEQIVADTTSGAPSNDAMVRVLTSLSTGNYDVTPALSFTLSSTVDPNSLSYTVAGFYRYKVQGKSSSNADTFTFTRRWRTDGVNL